MFIMKSLLLALASQGALVGAVGTLQIDTTVGQVYGMLNGSAPHVAQFLGVPFAEPPVGKLRFLAPQKKTPEARIDATQTGPSCPQFLLTKENSPSVYTYDTPWLQPYGPVSEDCLTLNVWTPYKPGNCQASEPLPVIVWIFGGGFYEGGLLTNGFVPDQWVERTQAHIVVSINYRVNIFGFPNARGINITEQNVGLMDQRAAVEWVRDNIAAFGGDPSRITLWGQSSGAASVDMYNFAYPDDPIVKGIIQHSGSVFATGVNNDHQQLNFSFVASHFGCGNLSAEAEVDCLREVNMTDIIEFYEPLYLNGSIKFSPIVDNVTKFGDNTARALAGKFAKLPAIIGNNANEQASLIAWPGAAGPNMTVVHQKTLSGEWCPASYSSQLLYRTNTTSFRYFNTANFSNISPRPWEGAYHTSELPLLFGTYAEYGGPSTPLEAATSAHWQDLYLAFMKDPVNGLPAMGWPAWEPTGSAIVFGNGTASSLISIPDLDAPCVSLNITYP